MSRVAQGARTIHLPEDGVGDLVLVDGRLCEVTRYIEVPEASAMHRWLEVQPLPTGGS